MGSVSGKDNEILTTVAFVSIGPLFIKKIGPVRQHGVFKALE